MKERYYVTLGVLFNGSPVQCLVCGIRIRHDGTELSGQLYHQIHGTSWEGDICRHCLYEKTPQDIKDAFDRRIRLLTRAIAELEDLEQRLSWGGIELPTAEELQKKADEFDSTVEEREREREYFASGKFNLPKGFAVTVGEEDR